MKKNRKKLRLNRETLRNLDAGHLHAVAGGGETDIVWQCEGGPQSGDVNTCADTNPSGGDTSVGCGTASAVCGGTNTTTTFHTN